MIEQIKELIVKIEGLAQLTKELKPCAQLFTTVRYANNTIVTFVHNEVFYGKPLMYNSIEIEKVVDSLYLSKSWLGKVLEELGESTPYINDGNRKTVEDIEPVADSVIDKEGVYHSFFTIDEVIEWNKKSHIEKVDWLRQEIKQVIEELPDYVKWIEEQIDNFYKTVKEDNKEDFCNKEEEFMASLPNLEFEFNLVYKYLCEARFWLRFEFKRIKEQTK
jgi:hypothetical protein